MTPAQQKLAKELEEDVLPCTWAPLEQHVKRQALFFVSGPDLLHVAVAVASDDKSQVQGYLERGVVARPTDAELKHWREYDGRFLCIIVQPYVFFVEVSDEN